MRLSSSYTIVKQYIDELLAIEKPDMSAKGFCKCGPFNDMVRKISASIKDEKYEIIKYQLKFLLAVIMFSYDDGRSCNALDKYEAVQLLKDNLWVKNRNFLYLGIKHGIVHLENDELDLLIKTSKISGDFKE